MSFIGVYSTKEHPFGLVFKFMDHLNLREHLKNNQRVTGRQELVRFHHRVRRFPLTHDLCASYWK